MAFTSIRPAKAAAVAAALATVALASAPARAAIPPPLRATIEAAMRADDPAAVAAIVRFASETHPDAAAEIDTLHREWQATKAEAQSVEAAGAAQPAATAQAGEAVRTAARAPTPAIPAPAAPDRPEPARTEPARTEPDRVAMKWSGQGQLGASHSSGNTRSTGLSAGLRVVGEAEHWRIKLAGEADYERNRGRTSRERYVLSVEPQSNIGDHALVYGLGQFESDGFTDFSSRYSLSGGAGYRPLTGPRATLELKTGPALRHARLKGGDGTLTELAGLFSLDFDWRITPTLKLSQDASAYVGNRNDSFASLTAIDSRLAGRLTGRLSYSVRHETEPLLGRERTDTLSRMSLVYDF